jgi:predicted transcriptional regulator
MGRSIKSSPKLLTETELELMTLLWSMKEGSVNEVMQNLPPGRDLAYTSVSTILRILEQKKIVGSRKAGRGHIYFPVLQKQDYEAASLGHLLEKVFNGEPRALVSRLLQAQGLTPADLDQVRELLREKDR